MMHFILRLDTVLGARPASMKSRSGVIVRLLLLGLMLMCAGARAASPLALIDASVFTGLDARIVEHATLLLRDGRIERIMDAGEALPAGYEAIDCEGYFLMPGLFDVHTHLDNVAAMRRALESGVTTVRSASTPAFQDVGLRELVRRGALPGPDVVAAGVYVTPNLEGSVMADPRLAPLYDGVQSDEALRLVVQVNADRGADVIKTRSTERAGLAETDPREQVYTRHQLEVIVDEARRHKLPVMVHAHGDEGARAAVEAGARSIEHGTYLSTPTLRLMKQKQVWFVPTLITMIEMNEEQYEPALRLRGAHMVPRLEQAVRDAHRLGVRFATGADNYYDAKSINRISLEIMHLVRLGLSPLQALRAATTSAAQLLGLQDRTGQIAEGYEADLILLPGNPLQDITAVQDVLLVISNGQVALKRIPFAKPEPVDAS